MIEQREDGWWIIPKTNWDCGEMGPYSTKKEAEDDRRGVDRFYRARMWETSDGETHPDVLST